MLGLTRCAGFRRPRLLAAVLLLTIVLIPFRHARNGSRRPPGVLRSSTGGFVWRHQDVNGCPSDADYVSEVGWFSCRICGIERPRTAVQRCTAPGCDGMLSFEGEGTLTCPRSPDHDVRI